MERHRDAHARSAREGLPAPSETQRTVSARARRGGLPLLAALAACSSSTDAARDAGLVESDAAITASDATATSLDASDPGCAPASTQPCLCEDGEIGRRACIDGAYGGACTDCRATSAGTLCYPGAYRGPLDIPQYYPNAAGVCGLFTLFGGPGRGELSFTLGEGTGGEFVEIAETENCLSLELSSDGGTPDEDAGTGVSALSMALSGRVDCQTGELKGEVRGVYYTLSFCNTSSKEYFSIKGTVKAQFNPDTLTFEDGVIDLHEPAGLFDTLGITAPPGGKGTFGATVQTDAGVPADAPDAAADASTPGDCLGGQPFKDFPIPG